MVFEYFCSEVEVVFLAESDIKLKVLLLFFLKEGNDIVLDSPLGGGSD